MAPSRDEKDRFLQYIREGNDRATAAWLINPDYTGSMFRSICNPSSPKHYDAEFAKEYDEAVEARGPLDPDRFQVRSAERASSSTTSTGFTKSTHLSPGQLEEFLDLVRDGVMASTAAGMLDPPTSITQIHRRAAKDKGFADEYREAKEEGYEAYKDELRGEASRQAFAGDYRALRDQMIIHLDDARSALTTQKHDIGNIDIRVLAERYFPELPKPVLDEMISSLEKKEFGELGPGSST